MRWRQSLDHVAHDPVYIYGIKHTYAANILFTISYYLLLFLLRIKFFNDLV